MPASTPEARVLLGKIAANERWSHETDRSAATAAARAAFDDRFEREVDPDGVLPPAERAARAENARRAFYQRMALKSVESRRKSAEARAAARRHARDANEADAELSAE